MRISVAAFAMDAHAVSRADYLAFVKTHAAWQRGAERQAGASTNSLTKRITPCRSCIIETQHSLPVTAVGADILSGDASATDGSYGAFNTIAAMGLGADGAWRHWLYLQLKAGF